MDDHTIPTFYHFFSILSFVGNAFMHFSLSPLLFIDDYFVFKQFCHKSGLQETICSCTEK